MVNQLKELACIIIDDNNKLYTSNNVKITDI
jgi:FAD:protein FMN transferase